MLCQVDEAGGGEDDGEWFFQRVLEGCARVALFFEMGDEALEIRRFHGFPAERRGGKPFEDILGILGGTVGGRAFEKDAFVCGGWPLWDDWTLPFDPVHPEVGFVAEACFFE